MLIPKQMIVEQLRSHGDSDAAERADEALDEKVDTERDGDLLAELGVDVDGLEEGFEGQSPAIG